MAQQIIDVGANANDGTGEPLREAFTAVNDNFTQIWTAGPVGSQVKISGNIVTTTVTNLGLTLAGNGIGNIQANSTVVPGTSGVYDLGAPDRTFQYIYGDYLVGNGALITGIVANTTYNNANVAAFLPTYTGNLVSLTGPVITTANIVAGNIITGGFLGVTGNITSVANITGNNLISSGRISAVGNITTTANVAGNYFIGNGAFLTGITATNIAAAALTGTTLSSNVLYSSLQVVDDLLYLDVVGNVTTQGRFIGSGAGLTNIPAANVTGQVANAAIAGTVYTNAQPNITSVGTLTSLTATGNITGNYFIGNGALLTGISTSGVNANALVGTTLSSNVLYSSLQVVDDLLYLDVVGNVTTQGRFIGSGAGLTNLLGANIVGSVANATYANIAGTAYSVAGANVTGTVANATYATIAGSATSTNTANTATYANTANAVAGANVSGTVANATYATTAGSATTATTATTAGTVTTAAQPNITSVGTLTSVAVSGNATAGNILTGGKISAVGNITGNYFIGNGALLTGVSATNVNANALIGDVLSSNVLYSSLKVVDDLLYLDVVGNITTTGRFIGSGAGLTNIPGGNVIGTVANATYAVTAGTATTATYANTANTVAGANVTGTVANATYAVTAGSATTAGTVTTAAQPNITSVGTLTSVTVTGNATGGNLLTAGVVSATGNITTTNYFIGNGRQLTGIQASEVGVLANLSVTGNTQTGNLLTGGTISAVGNIRTTGNVTGNYFIGNGSQLTGIIASAGAAITNGNSNVTVNANGNVTVGVTGTSNVAVFANTGAYVAGVVSATGNVTGNYLLGNGALITGLPAGYSNADVGNYLPTYTGNLVSLTGPVTTTSNVTGGNVLTGGLVSATGNVTGGNINSPTLNNSANINVVANTAQWTFGTNGYLNFPRDVAGNIDPYLTIVGGANPAITSTDVSLAGPANLAMSVDFLNISGYTGNKIVAYPDQGVLAADANLVLFADFANAGNTNSYWTFGTDGVLTAPGNIITTANVTGGNVLTGGLISATGNITAGNLLTGGVVSATGNISGNYFIGNGSQLTGVAASSVNANALIGNTLSSNVLYSSLTQVGNLANLSVVGNTVSGNLLTGGLISATSTITSAANITGGNILTSGLISAVGNISGNYVLGNGALLTGVITSVANINNGTSNVTVVSSGGNIAIGVGGTGNVAVFATTGEYVTGVISASGNVTGGNVLTAGLISATSTITSAANITGGNVLTGGLISAIGNIQGNVFIGNGAGLTSLTGANVTGTVANATYASLAGTVTNNAQANITSVGILTSLSVSGNTTTGNLLTGGLISATSTITSAANITGGNLLTAGLISATSTITSAANITGGNILTAGLISATGNVTGGNVNTNNIFGTALTITSTGVLNLAPTGNITANSKNITGLADPVQDQDAATKAYVDNVAQGLDPKASVSLATATTLPAYTYSNGTAGVGATITGSASGLLTIDGTSPTVGDRVLIKNETGGNAPYNGIYTVTTNSAGSAYELTRAADMNQSTEVPGAFTFVELGTVNADSGYVCTTNAPVVIGTTAIVWTQFSSAGSYTANTSAGLSLIGSQFNAKVDENTTAFDGSGNIIVKAGANLTTPNIGAATGTSISLTGNVTGGNVLTGGVITATANITGGNIRTAGQISATGNITGNYFLGNGSALTGVIAAGGQGNTITLGTPTDGNLVQNVAYPGWTTATFVTDGLDDLNQVALNIANSTYVGNAYITANVSSGPSPLSVALTGRYVGNPNAYLWQFGDGTANATTANAVHTFSNVSGGTFTVTYTAYNTNGTYNGNVANGAKGSTSTASTTITLYTPTPIPSFTANRTTLDTPGAVLITNTSLYAETFSINWGDGTIVIPANNWTTASHTFTNATANTDVLYGVNLTGNSANAGATPVSVTSSNTNVKVYSSQASNVFVTANRANVINGSGIISFRNDSNGAPGNTASFGAQQYYYLNYGDGNVSNVVIASGTAGNPGAANVTNTFALSAANQSGNIYQQFTANLSLYTGYSTSPFKSSNITITVEPQTRANFVGTTANVITDATANTGNARVGYLYTDYNGANRSTFTFQNTSENSNIANWTWGDATFSNGVSNVGNTLHTYTGTGAFTVSLQANGTPNGITSTAQSNTLSTTGYIFIAANPTAPTALSGFANLTIANASQGTSPLLAAGATDASGGNIPANGTSVTRFATTATITTSANVQNANTAVTGTLTAYVNNAAAGNVTFTTGGNTVGTTGALVVSADRDLHVANAAVPSYFYKVFSANVSCALSSLSTGYNNYKMVHSVSGNTNYVGFVKDNLNTAPSLVTSNVLMVESTAGTYRYISGIPYYNTGSPAITIANLEVSNLAGQTYTSTTPFTLASGTVYEGSGAVLSANQTKTLAQLDNAGNSMLTGSNVKANIGVSANYTFGNLTGNITGANNSVSTLQANILNVIGTGTTTQLPTKIQMYAGANSGVNEQSITCTPTANTQAAIRIIMSTAGNTPVFSDSTNFYTANAWSGAQTIAGTPEAVVRYGVLTQYAVDLSTGYLPVGPNLSVTGNRTSTQYFTFAFARPSLANFDIRLTTTTGVAGVWLAAPGTTIDKSGFSSPTPGFPGPTSTINGWLETYTQYAGSGVPGAASGTGGNGSNGCALTGADVIPLNTAIANVGYTMTLGSQNAANSTGNNILIRIALASGQSITALSIGVAA